MKSNLLFMAFIITALMTSCNGGQDVENKHNQNMGEIIGKATPEIENGIMTPEVLHSFGRISNVQVSPNKEDVLYQVTYVDIEQNKTNTELFKMNVDGTEKRQLTFTNDSESNAQWIEGGEKVAFLSRDRKSVV